VSKTQEAAGSRRAITEQIEGIDPDKGDCEELDLGRR